MSKFSHITLPKIIAIAGVLSVSQITIGQVDEGGFEGGVYGSLGVLELDSDKAYAAGVGDTGFLFEAGYYGVINGLFTFKAGLYSVSMDDERQFSQETENAFGDRSTDESSIFGWGAVFEGGVRFPLNETVSLGGAAGLRTLSAEREIALCSDCRTDKLNLDGGGFIRPYVNIGIKQFDLEFAYEHYLSGDYARGFTGSFIWNF